MSGMRQVGVNMVFNADARQAKEQINSLIKDLNKLGTTGGQSATMPITKQILEARGAAQQLSLALGNAINQDTGRLNLTKFNQELKSAGLNINQLATKMASMGPEGEKAFLQVANSILRAETSLKRTNTVLDKFKTTMANTVRWQISSSMLNAFTGAVQKAYGYAQDLNESLNNIRIVTGQNIDQMTKFAKEANQAAKALNTTTTEYTNASLIYYQQGLSDQEVKDRTDVTIKLANVARESAEVVSDQMTAVWNNFYDGSKSLEYYADVMTALGAATASSTDEISAGLNKFAATANTVGLSYEYAASALATVTATTRESADVVGTAFKTLFARIQDLELGETLDDGTTLGKYSEALNAVGISIMDQNGELRDMDDILDDMGNKWDKLSKAQQVALAQTVGGTRQYAQLIALMDNWDYFQENLGVANTSSGALQEQADIYAESWEAARDRVTAAAETIYQQLLNDDFFIKLNDFLADGLGFVSNLIDSLGGLSGVIVTVTSMLVKAFGTEISGAIDKSINSLFRFGNTAQSEASKILKDTTKAAKGMIDTHGQDAVAAPVENAQYRMLNENNEIQSKYIQIQDQLTEAQRVVIEQKVRELQLAQDISLEAAKQLEIEQKKAEEIKNSIQANISATQNTVQKNSNWKETINRISGKNYTDIGNEVQNLGIFNRNLVNTGASLLGSQDETVELARQAQLSLEDTVTDPNNTAQGNKVAVEKYKAALEALTKKIQDHLKAEEKLVEQIELKAQEAVNESKSQAKMKTQSAEEDAKLEEIDSKTKNAKITDIIKGSLLMDNAKRDELLNKSVKEQIAGYKAITASAGTMDAAVLAAAESQEGTAEITEKNIHQYLGLASAARTTAIKMDEVVTTSEDQDKAFTGAQESISNLGLTYKTIGDATAGLLQGISSMGASLQSLYGIINTINNEDLTFWEKFAQILAVAPMVVGQFSSSLASFGDLWKFVQGTETEGLKIAWQKLFATEANTKAVWSYTDATGNKIEEETKEALITKLNTAGIKFNTAEIIQNTEAEKANLLVKLLSNKALLVTIGILVLAGALVAHLATVWTEAYNAEAKAAEEAAASAERLADAAAEAKSAFDEIASTVDNYKELLTTLDDCTKNTEEWEEALRNVNEATADIIAQYPELLTKENLYNSDGTINTDVLDNAVYQAEQANLVAQAAATMARANSMDLTAKSNLTNALRSDDTGLLDALGWGEGTGINGATNEEQREDQKKLKEAYEQSGEKALALTNVYETLFGITDGVTQAQAEYANSIIAVTRETQNASVAMDNAAKTVIQAWASAQGIEVSGAETALMIGRYKDDYEAIYNKLEKNENRVNSQGSDADASGLAEQYLEITGKDWKTAKNTVRGNDDNREFVFVNDAGDEEEIPIKDIIATVAAYQAQQGIDNLYLQAINVLNELRRSAGDDYANGIEGWLSSNNFNAMTFEDLQQLQQQVNTKGVQSYLEEIGLWESLSEAQRGDFEKSITEAMDAWSSVGGDSLTESARKALDNAFKGLEDSVTVDDKDAVAKTIAAALDMGGEAGPIADTFSEIMSEAADLEEEDQQKIIDAFTNTDWTQQDAMSSFRDSIGDLNDEFDVDLIRRWANALRDANNAILNYNVEQQQENWGTVDDFLSELGKNASISKKDMEEFLQSDAFRDVGLNEDQFLSEFFQMEKNGSYTFIGQLSAIQDKLWSGLDAVSVGIIQQTEDQIEELDSWIDNYDKQTGTNDYKIGLGNQINFEDLAEQLVNSTYVNFANMSNDELQQAFGSTELNELLEQAKGEQKTDNQLKFNMTLTNIRDLYSKYGSPEAWGENGIQQKTGLSFNTAQAIMETMLLGPNGERVGQFGIPELEEKYSGYVGADSTLLNQIESANNWLASIGEDTIDISTEFINDVGPFILSEKLQKLRDAITAAKNKRVTQETKLAQAQSDIGEYHAQQAREAGSVAELRGLEATEAINTDLYNEQIEATARTSAINADLDWDIVAEQADNYKEAISGIIESEEDAIATSYLLAEANQKLVNESDELTSNWDNWKETLLNTDVNSTQYITTAHELTDALARMFGLGEDFNIDSGIYKENLGLIEEMLNDNEQAAQLLMGVIAKYQVTSAEYTDTMTNTTQSAFDAAKNNLSIINAQIASIDNLNQADIFSTEGLEEYRDYYINSINEWAKAFELGEQQLQELLRSFGVITNNVFTDASGEFAQVGQDAIFSAISILDFSSLNKETPGAKKKFSDEIERYHEINEEIDDLTRQYDRLAEARNRAFGADKIALMDQELKSTQNLISAQEQYLNEIEKYKARDKANLINDLGLTESDFDEQGRLVNYTGIMEELVNDFNMSDRDEVAEAEYEWKKSALEQYEETLNLQEEESENLTKLKNQFEDLKLEKVEVTLELNVSLVEDQLETLDYLLEKFKDDATDAAEKLALITKQVDEEANRLEATQQAVNEIAQNHDFNNIQEMLAAEENLELTQAEVDALREYKTALIDSEQALENYRQNAIDTLTTSFSAWNDEMSEGITKIERYSSTLETFQNIIDIIGKDSLGISNEMLIGLSNASVEMSLNKLEATKTKMDQLRASEADAQAHLLAAREAGAAEEIAIWEEALEKIEEQTNEAEDEALATWEETIQAAADMFESTVEKVIDNYKQAMGDLDQLQTQFDQATEISERYVADYKEIYELTKLNRDITNSMDNATIKSKTMLRDLQQEINDLMAEDVEMSQYDLDYLRKKYELRLAEIALEEAQNAKSQVRMRRDSEGNYSYVFTADQEEIDKAEQNVEDKLYEMQELNSEYITEMSSNILKTEQELAEALAELDRTKYASEVEYQAAVEELTAYYYGKRSYYLDEMNKALQNNSETYNVDWYNYSQATGYKMSKDEEYMTSFNETIYSQITGYKDVEEAQVTFKEATDTMVTGLTEAYATWKDQTEQALGIMNTSMQGYGDLVKKVVYGDGEESTGLVGAATDAGNATKDMANEMDANFKTALGYLQGFAEAYKNLYSGENGLIKQNQDYIKSIDDLIKKEVEHVDNYEDVGDRIIGENTLVDSSMDSLAYALGEAASAAIELKNALKGIGDIEEFESYGDESENVLFQSYRANFGSNNSAYAFEIASDGSMKTIASDMNDSRTIKGGTTHVVTDVYEAPNGKTYYKIGDYWYLADLFEEIAKYNDIDTGFNNTIPSRYLSLVTGLDTGGYTGTWDGPATSENGRLAMLHQKELVLNADDTTNMLKSIEMVRNIARIIDLNAGAALSGLGQLNTNVVTGETQGITQAIEIHADFPNATNHSEIEEAFNNLFIQASQFANRKNK